MAQSKRSLIPVLASCVLAQLPVNVAHAQQAAVSTGVEVRQGVPPPGRYRVQSRSAGKCLGWVVQGIRTPFLGLMTRECGNDPNANLQSTDARRGPSDHSSFYIVPITRLAFAVYHYGECLTKARNVIIGPASIDYVRCGAGSEVRQSGLLAVPDDQRFRMSQMPDGGVRIYPVANRTASRRLVLTVRDNGTAPGTDIIAWPFNQSNDQTFDLIYMGPLSEELQVEYRAAMAAADARAPETPEDPALPVEAISARYASAGTPAAAVSAKAGLFRAANGIGNSADGTNINALRASAPLPPPTEISMTTGFALDMGVSPASATLDAPSARAEWRLAIPYRFAVEGLKAASVSCVLEDANGAPVGERTARLDVNGPSAGTLLIGIPRREGTTASPVKTECQASLGGERAGTDWEAWTFAAPAMPSGWDVYVKEAGKSRFWTGAPFQPGFSLHIVSR